MQFTNIIATLALMASPLVSAQAGCTEWSLETYTVSDCGQDDNTLPVAYYSDVTAWPCTAFDSEVTIESVAFDAAAQWSVTYYETADCNCPFTLDGIFTCPNGLAGESSGGTICTASGKYLSFVIEYLEGECGS